MRPSEAPPVAIGPAGPASPARRALLRAAGVGAFAVFAAGCGTLPVVPKRPAASASDALGWIRHDGDGRYTLRLPRIEMGQGVAGALKRVACDELEVAWSAVTIVLPSTADLPAARATVGSESIRDFALPLARACAALREALAAGRAPAAGAIVVEPRDWPQLRAGRRMAAGAVPGDARGPRRADPLEHGVAIVRGEPLYVADMRVPGMRFGRVLRAPAAPELASRAVRLDGAAARAQPGFVALVRDPLLRLGASEGIGIVASTPGALDRIERALAVDWRTDGRFDAASVAAAVDVDARLANGARPTRRLLADTIDTHAPWDVDLRIDLPAAAHAAIEPRAALAEPDGDDGLRLWVGSQDPFYVRDVVATRLRLGADRVRVQPCRVGGAFGGKTICTVELEAAVLARATRAPVRVQWTRAQEFALGFHRPPSSHRVRARLRDGRLHAWWHALATSHVMFTGAVVPAWLQRATDLAVGDDGAARGAKPPYAIAARRVELHLARLPVWTGPWRGLGAGPNGLAIECAIDECARRARVDPVRFRLEHLADAPRLAGVLRRVAASSGWVEAAPAASIEPVAATAAAAPLRGRGVACGIYKETSFVAVAADVEVDPASGAVRVARLWCVHDCGRVIDPDQVRAQCEGNLVWGLGMALVESLPIGDGAVAAATFADSPIARHADVPPMTIELVDADAPPGGAGETAIVAAGAAILNAVRDATGVRASRLPIGAAALAAALRSGEATA